MPPPYAVVLSSTRPATIVTPGARPDTVPPSGRPSRPAARGARPTGDGPWSADLQLLGGRALVDVRGADGHRHHPVPGERQLRGAGPAPGALRRQRDRQRAEVPVRQGEG